MLTSNKNCEMVVRCDQLRLIGLLQNACYFDCHSAAGCVGEQFPGGHTVIYCCTRIDSLTSEEISIVLAHIPMWQAHMLKPMYVQRLYVLLTNRVSFFCRRQATSNEEWREVDAWSEPLGPASERGQLLRNRVD